jgi:hypothetical protein
VNWTEEEFIDLDLGDKRLNKRFKLLLEKLSLNPTASIPEACGGWTETQGAYRFLAQGKMDWRDMHEPHKKNTLERMQDHKVILCLQDTAELNFNGQSIVGLGRLSYEAQKGMYVHPTYAVTTDREPLGVLDAWMWARKEKGEDDLSESLRWLEGYERICEMATKVPDTRLVYIADRESDILGLILKGEELNHPADWLIRSKHNRVLEENDKLWDSVLKEKGLGCISFVLPGRGGNKARKVKQTIYSKRITLPNKAGKRIVVSCVIAREDNPPDGVKPVQWRLLTNRLAGDFESAVQLVDWYRARWEIEIFFHIFKNGCKIEALQLSTIDRIEKALIMFMIVAWRVGRLMRLGRTCPDLPASLFFSEVEWKAAFIMNKDPLPKTMPSLNEVVRLTAILGGFLGRKSDGEPGVKTIWQGLTRLADFAFGLQCAQEFYAL